MKHLFIAVAAIALVAPLAADAHGPRRQRIAETVEIAAPPEAVWERISQFGEVEWHPALQVAEGGDSNEVGTMRTVAFGSDDGPTMTEELTRYAPENMMYQTFSADIDLEALPVTNYASTLTVSPSDDGGSVVEWKAGFYRGFPNNDPPEGLDDRAAVEAVTAHYRSGLDALKTMLEGTN
jgi:hypothetical protein